MAHGTSKGGPQLAREGIQIDQRAQSLARTFLRGAERAVGARVGFLSRVHSRVTSERVLVSRSEIAQVACKRLLSRVHPHVRHQRP